MRATKVELTGESLVYKYVLEYIITYLPKKSSENRIRLLEEYSIRVSLTTEYPKDQDQKCRSTG